MPSIEATQATEHRLAQLMDAIAILMAEGAETRAIAAWLSANLLGVESLSPWFEHSNCRTLAHGCHGKSLRDVLSV